MTDPGSAGAAPEAASRHPDDVVAGVIRVRFGHGGRDVRDIPTLKGITKGPAHRWKSRLMSALAEVKLPATGGYTPEWGAQFANIAGEKMAELLLAYDQTNALCGGGTAEQNRDWLEEHADDRQLWTAFLEVLKAAFPFVDDPREFVIDMLGSALREQQAEQLKNLFREMTAELPASTNGRSTSGEASAAPTRSRRGSRKSS